MSQQLMTMAVRRCGNAQESGWHVALQKKSVNMPNKYRTSILGGTCIYLAVSTGWLMGCVP